MSQERQVSESPYLRAKIVFSGQLECLTGLHIGGVEAGVDVGGIDKYVVRNPYNNEPYIPGSSLKGKIRSLVEYALASRSQLLGANRIASVVDLPNVKRLFGEAINQNTGQPSRVLFRDAILSERDRNQPMAFSSGLKYTERKAENTLKRITAQATPRQIERIPAGTSFGLSMVLNVDSDSFGEDAATNPSQRFVDTYLEMLELGYRLLQYDGLGGMVSRGYGQVGIGWSKIEIWEVKGSQLVAQEFSGTEFSALRQHVAGLWK